MKNLDMMQQKRTEIMQSLSNAIAANDEAAVSQALESMASFYGEIVDNQINGVMEDVDRTILAGRGVRQLTSAETKYYQAVIDASKSSNPKQAITNIDVAFPETIIDAVLEDIAIDHPLLDAIDFVNTTLISRYIYNSEGTQKAVWGAINSVITEELEGSIADLDLKHCKLTAYMFLSQDMIEAGPAWVDRYVRAVLTDALALGMEDAVVNGDGVDEPIGMIMTSEKNSDGTQKAQTPTALTEITPKSVGTLIADLAVSPSGRPRKVNGLILVVNPTTYYKRLMPATTMQMEDGTYKNDIFPVPCQFIQSTAVADDKAAFGMGKQYIMGMGLPKGGKLEYSDEFKFLDDLRTYKIKFLGNGRPKDFASFKYLDISSLKEMIFRVHETTPTA